jgi:hypothetical protein
MTKVNYVIFAGVLVYIGYSFNDTASRIDKLE